MPTIDPDRILVAVGVISDHGGRLLLQQRLEGTPCAGQWEFPGGKLEAGESAEQALRRELQEELGIAVQQSTPLLQLCHDYPHAKVRLEVMRVEAFGGEPHGAEGQSVVWVSPEEAATLDLLPAAWSILAALPRSQNVDF
ncbi:MAG: 8-oxo-dGTP diphosphatase MutT [Pseudomonadota bacterium]|nr:8-oxo-dGTP diphosphatase MutT [Pseudomonadota bacterium]